jgi:hypothetical protein
MGAAQAHDLPSHEKTDGVLKAKDAESPNKARCHAEQPGCLMPCRRTEPCSKNGSRQTKTEQPERVRRETKIRPRHTDAEWRVNAGRSLRQCRDDKD